MREFIQAQLQEEFERRLFEAALRNLDDLQDPLRFNNFAYSARELVRNVLARRAPDKEVLQCVWYKNEIEGKKDGVTRSQRVIYAVQGGLADDFVKDELNIDLGAVKSELTAAIGNLSKYTHVGEDTFDIDAESVDEHVAQALNAIGGLFAAIDRSRKIVVDALWEVLDESTIEACITTSLEAVDSLASHYSLEEVYTDEIKITAIDTFQIVFEARGSVTCGLQWGSNSDVARGDGAEGEVTFPFSCRLWSNVDEPKVVQTDEEAFTVDTRDWHD